MLLRKHKVLVAYGRGRLFVSWLVSNVVLQHVVLVSWSNSVFS